MPATPPNPDHGPNVRARWVREEMAQLRAVHWHIPAGSTLLGPRIILLPRLRELPGRAAKRLDDGANTAIESGLILALIAIVMVAGVLAVAAIKISAFVHFLGSFVIH